MSFFTSQKITYFIGTIYVSYKLLALEKSKDKYLIIHYNYKHISPTQVLGTAQNFR